MLQSVASRTDTPPVGDPAPPIAHLPASPLQLLQELHDTLKVLFVTAVCVIQPLRSSPLFAGLHLSSVYQSIHRRFPCPLYLCVHRQPVVNVCI